MYDHLLFRPTWTVLEELSMLLKCVFLEKGREMVVLIAQVTINQLSTEVMPNTSNNINCLPVAFFIILVP